MTVVFITSVSVAYSRIRFSLTERKIIQWTDERHNADSIANYLFDKDAAIVWRAAWGLANIEDTSVRKQLITAFHNESREECRSMIAFALGVLGESKQSFEALTKSPKIISSDIARAIGRTIPAKETSVFSPSIRQWITKKVITEENAGLILIEISLRKILTPELASLAAELAKSDHLPTQQNAIYVFTRTDSALAAPHIGIISESLKELGSADIRSFAASALGRISSDSAIRILLRAGRSEKDWRVQVTIINSLQKSRTFTSAIYDILRRSVEAGDRNNPASIHISLTAANVLDAMISAGKVSGADSITIKNWLDGFRLDMEQYIELPLSVRAQLMVSLARFGFSIDLDNALSGIYSYRNRFVNRIAARGYGVCRDTLFFRRLLTACLQSSPENLYPFIEALHEHWDLALKDTSYLRLLEQEKFAIIYKRLLMRLPSQMIDPSVVTTTLTFIQDSSLLNDPSMRADAEEYLLQYLDKFAEPKFIEHLNATLSAIRAYKPQHIEFKTKLQSLYKLASEEWGYRSIVDSIAKTIQTLGEKPDPKVNFKIMSSSIDWELLENSSDTILIQYAPDIMFVQLAKKHAPVTCAKMMGLMEINFFAMNPVHRVVPNFVIQAGDPTASGFGGPGYMMRREISNLYYETPAIIGMASSGKDTEGSQWFATQCPTPHLNSRYTIWGKIVEGFSGLYSIQVGDKIDNIIRYRE
jgi:cyclophilin family peptidyl-prolyl cis-trans isomerase/HEAT repeat protein